MKIVRHAPPLTSNQKQDEIRTLMKNAKKKLLRKASDDNMVEHDIYQHEMAEIYLMDSQLYMTETLSICIEFRRLLSNLFKEYNALLSDIKVDNPLPYIRMFTKKPAMKCGV